MPAENGLVASLFFMGWDGLQNGGTGEAPVDLAGFGVVVGFGFGVAWF